MSWPRVSLADISESIDYGHTASADTNAVGPKFLRITDIQDGRVDWSSVPRCICSESGASKYALQDGDIVFARTGATTGKSYLLSQIPEEAVFASYLIRVRPCQGNVDPGYLSQFFDTQDYWAQINRSSSGTAQGGVNASKLKMLSIPLPPLSEQRRIAAILDKADALRAKRRETIAKLDQLLKSVFLEMFGDPVTNPKEWPVVSIQQACESIVDCVNRTAPTVDYVTDYKMIRTTNVRNYKVSLDSVRYVEKAVFDDWNRRLLPQKGDVILTREAPAGEAGILDSDDQVFLGQRLMLYRVSQQRATPEYLLYSFMGEGMQQQFKKQSSGSTVKHLSVPDCRSWDLMLPPVELQKKFTEIALMNWSLRQQALAHSNRLEDLFFSIQKSAFSAEP
ncbi:restriction endonuclease subunit S [Pseudomonas reactans]